MRVVRGRADDPEADRRVTADLVERTRETGTPALRVWRPDRQVVFGRRDERADGYERAREAAEGAGFPTVVRSTGGRAVAYTGTTVAVALARPSDDLRSGLDERYEETLETLQRSLWRLGVPAQRGEPADAFCPGSHSLSWKGKLVGAAQRVRTGVALVGAVVVVDGHDEVASVLGPVYDARGLAFDPDSVGSVERAGGRAAPEEVVETVEAAFLDEHAPEGPAEVERVGE